MKKTASSLLLILLTSSVVSLSMPMAVAQPTSPEILSIATMENVTLLEDGTSHLALLINVSSSQLADMYRKTLGAPPEAGIEEEMEIPENMTLPVTIDAGENVTLDGLNVTELVVPVREEFYKSIVQEQQILFGNVTEIVDSKMVPRGSGDECRVWVSGYASLQIVNVTKVDSDEMWEIAVGPMDYKAAGIAAGFVSIKIALMQQMLESLTGEQIYEYSWSTKIQLPVDATLLNGDELEGLNWTIDFGGGTYMNASVSLDGTSTIILDERTVVTEGNITLTPEYLYQAFSGYKVFEIGYLLPYSGEGCESKKAGEIDDWSYDWSVTIAPGTLPAEFTYTPTPGVTLSASLEVTPSLTISGHIGWDIGAIWKYKHTWPCIKWWYFIIATKKFEAWMDLSASIKVGLTASATASVSKTWQIELFTWKTTYSFTYGPIPVWADLKFSVTPTLTASADGTLSFDFEATAWGHFRGGVGYTRDGGWYTIKQVNMGADRTGPTINVTASASITPSVKFRLSFLVYGIAGPFIEFEPYATATITYTTSYTWEIKLGFKITAGCTFAGWLKDLLGLSDYWATLGDWQLARWSGTGQQPPVASFTVSDYLPTVCSAVTFDATSSYDPDGTIVKYEWDWEGDCTYDFDAGIYPITYHHYDTYGYYYPKLRVTDNDGLTSETQRFIWARQHPVACFDWTPEKPCMNECWPTVGENVTFDASCSTPEGGVILAYMWDFGDGTYDAGQMLPHHYDTCGDYTVTLTVIDSEWLGDSISKTIHIRAPPHAEFTWTPERPQVCETVTFDASASTPNCGVIVSWDWDFGDGTIGSGEIVTHHYDTCGDYIVTLNVTDDETKSDNITKTIHIRAPPHASFTYSPHELYAPGTGEVVTFDASASTPNCGVIINYVWNFGDTTPAVTESDPITTHIFTTHGTYNVTLTVFDSEDKNDTTWQLVTVTTHDVAVVDVTPESNWLYQGKLCHANINVTVCNEGDVPETFNVTLYYNITAGQTIGIQTVTNLPSGNCTTLTFLWDTTEVTPCHNYTITAVADTVPHETDTADNTLESPTKVKVRLLGDVNDDGKIDMKDITRAAWAFGSYPGHPRWIMYDGDMDINNDGKIDMRDIVFIARNFGKTCT